MADDERRGTEEREAESDTEQQQPPSKRRKSQDPAPQDASPEPAETTTPKNDEGKTPTAGTPARTYDVLRMAEYEATPESTSNKEFGSRFSELADHLMRHCVLEVCGVQHCLTEIEFYYNGPPHPDVFTHGDPDQKSCGTWYFHKTGSNYKAGTYKGLDLTFGGPQAYGGILIRGLRKLDYPREFVDGPCKCVDHILAIAKAKSIAEFVARQGGNLTAVLSEEDEEAGRVACQELRVVTRDPQIGGGAISVLACPRVGLVVRGEEKLRFSMREYRFLTELKETKKGKQFITLGMRKNLGKGTADICHRTGCKATTVENQIALFEEGKKMSKAPDVFGEQLSADQCCRLYGYCAAHDMC